jgi:hypothetical protein
MDDDPDAEQALERVLGVELELLRQEHLQVLQPRAFLLRQKRGEPGKRGEPRVPPAANIQKVPPRRIAGRTSSA